LIVKITEGASAAVIVAGHDIKYYGEAAGSFIDFRSAAMHRSVMGWYSDVQSANLEGTLFVRFKHRREMDFEMKSANENN
jgi:hypothetical protein